MTTTNYENFFAHYFKSRGVCITLAAQMYAINKMRSRNELTSVKYAREHLFYMIDTVSDIALWDDGFVKGKESYRLLNKWKWKLQDYNF